MLKKGVMIKMRRYVMILSALLLLFIGLPENKASAAIADGTHSLNFQVNKPDSSSASMANDYFIKPAKLIVSNGSMKVQMTIKNSSWVTEFNPPGGATVISSNPSADTRVVQFSISSLNTLKVAMKIDIDDIDYHHAYTVDFVFNGSGLPEKQEQQAAKPPSSNNNASTSSSQPAASDKSTSSSNSAGAVSSTPANSTGNNTTNSTENTAAPTASEETADEEQQATTTSEEDNPETSDALPIVAMLIFAAAFVVLLSSKKRQTT